MPTVQYRPTSPGRRFQTGSDFAEITKARPEGSLTAPLHKTGGRNNLGRMTIRHRGGGHKRLYRVIDFKRDKLGVPARVADIESGNSLALSLIPLGTMVHNVELREGRGGQLGRSAGTAIQLMAKEGDYALLKLPSGELRRVRLACRATVGQVGNL